MSELYMTKQVFSNKDVFRAILYADLDFESPPWDSLSGGAFFLKVAVPCSGTLVRRPGA